MVRPFLFQPTGEAAQLEGDGRRCVPDMEGRIAARDTPGNRAILEGSRPLKEQYPNRIILQL